MTNTEYCRIAKITTAFILLIFTCFLIPALFSAHADSIIELEKQELQKLKNTINKQIEIIQKRRYRNLKYVKEFSEIEFAVALKRKNVLLSELMLKKYEKDIHSIQAEIGKLKLNRQKKQKFLQKRIKDLFKISKQPLLASLLSKESIGDIYYQLEYLRMLVKNDQLYVREYEKLLKFWIEKKQTLEKLKMTAVVSKQEIWPQKEGLKEDLTRRKQFFSNLKKNPTVYRKFLDEMKYCHQMLHTQLSDSEGSSQGQGLDQITAEKKLPLPLDSNLLKNQKNYWRKNRFHPVGGGIEFFVPEGSEILAAASGKICFADWFIGFGNTVIIDHGKNWFSLYTFCSSLEVDKNDTVDAGQLIAYVGDSSSLRGFALYFELIHENNLVLPMDAFGIKF